MIIKDFDSQNQIDSYTNINEKFQSKIGIKRLLTFNQDAYIEQE